MKKLASFGVILAAISLLAALYLQFSLVPKKNMSDSVILNNSNESFYGTPEHSMHLHNLDFGTDFAIYVLMAGLLSFVICIIPAVKKIKIAWLGVVLALVASFIGIIHGTHMLS